MILQQGDDEEGPVWRTKHIGRGVPEEKPKPQRQAISGTEVDTAVMLQTRGDVTEVEDEHAENLLARLTAKKADWLYSPRNSPIRVTRKRRSSSGDFTSAVQALDSVQE